MHGHPPALVLNADFQPLSYLPLSTIDWQAAVKAVYEATHVVVAEYERVVRSPSITMRLPSVLALRRYVPSSDRVAFTRFNVFLRDGFCCQYCGDSGELTFDHVVPKSRDGVSSWVNVVAACTRCNTAKGNRMDMVPRRAPREPTSRELLTAKRAYPPNHLHETWLDWLHWDAVLER